MGIHDVVWPSKYQVLEDNNVMCLAHCLNLVISPSMIRCRVLDQTCNSGGDQAPAVPAQAVRNLDDLTCMACPPKYRQMNTFYKYYIGQLTAPVLTLFSRHSLLSSCRLGEGFRV